MSKVGTVDLENSLFTRSEWDTAEQNEPELPPTGKIEDVHNWLFKNFGSHERLPVLLDVAEADIMDYDDWLTVLGEQWPYFDNVGVHKDCLFAVVWDMVSDIETVIPQMMSAEERAAFNALQEQITIYRGCGPRNMFGFAWSLDREVAAKFPFMRRYWTDQPRLLTATINKSRAAALKLGRDEHEIVVFDFESEPSIRWTEEPLLRDSAGNLIKQANRESKS
jgi:hypothetical protein